MTCSSERDGTRARPGDLLRIRTGLTLWACPTTGTSLGIISTGSGCLVLGVQPAFLRTETIQAQAFRDAITVHVIVLRARSGRDAMGWLELVTRDAQIVSEHR